MSSDYAKLKNLALRLLTRREHSYFELQQKLQRYSEETALIEDVLRELQQKSFQSDIRFAKAYIYSRSQRGYGSERIRQELLQRRISADLIEAALEEAEIHWQELASAVHRKKFGSRLPTSPEERARQSRFLFYRGFSADEIQRIFRQE